MTRIHHDGGPSGSPRRAGAETSDEPPAQRPRLAGPPGAPQNVLQPLGTGHLLNSMAPRAAVPLDRPAAATVPQGVAGVGMIPLAYPAAWRPVDIAAPPVAIAPQPSAQLLRVLNLPRFGLSPESLPPDAIAAGSGSNMSPLHQPPASVWSNPVSPHEAAPRSPASSEVDAMIDELLLQPDEEVTFRESGPYSLAGSAEAQSSASASTAATGRLLSAALESIAREFPRADREGNQIYARRLHELRLGLSLHDLSRLSGAAKGDLRKDPAFGPPLTPNLTAVLARLPRHDGENNIAYARRLHQHDAGLSVTDLARLSGTPEGNLRQDPTFGPPLTPELAEILARVPRHGGENNIAYARRLHQYDAGLSVNYLSRLSGASEGHIKREPTFRPPLPSQLARVLEDVPRRDTEANLAYARRLHQHDAGLSVTDLSRLSGAREFHIREDRTFGPQLTPELAAILEQRPRGEHESNSAYALRLHEHDPALSDADLSRLSGALPANIRRDRKRRAARHAARSEHGEPS